ncbi:hypothetical protein [Nocardia pseudobrasiliensis]|uniref:PE-PPE domain-containing protein n=1 Tax=Nocardia pseudobrasiliensis TaxID=45979 RepID=A0A370IBD4_9NOCA|nr:hypothetical protein [Nocardia pseudobrasiliensis]RDI68017.1 hypothetical protein DFR76_102418 [Nocardia pseudobrasiliensis]
MYDVITFRGTGEPQTPDGAPAGMVSEVTRHLDPSRFRCREPLWPAQISPLGPGGNLSSPSLRRSVDIGVAAGVAAIRESGDVCGLISYSLGAIVASTILEGVAAGEFRNADGSPLEIAFAILFANPLRSPGDSVHNLCAADTFGLHGEHGPWPELDVQEYACPRDIITASPKDSPLRMLDTVVGPFSFVEGARLGNAGPSIIGELVQLCIADPNRNFHRYLAAFDGAAGYLTPWPHGTHVLYSGEQFDNTGMTWTEHAADYLNTRY